MRYSDRSPITFQDDLPESVDVAIIGAGVIGISTAWFLARAGHSVLVCEKGRVAGEQSSRNWGWVRQNGRDGAELPIMMDSINIWEGLAAELGEEIGFARGGCLFLTRDPADIEEFDEFMGHARAHGLDTRLLSGREIDDLIDDRPGQWYSGMYTPSDGRAEPWLAVPALARGLQKTGGLVRENCAVRCLDMEGGQVAGIATEHGRVRAKTVVCAGGAWSSMFLETQGIRLPQLTVKSTVARTSPGPEIFAGEACGHDLAFRRRHDGGYTLALIDVWEHYVGRDSFRFCREFVPLLKTSWSHTNVLFREGLLGRLSAPGAWDGDSTSPFELERVLDPEPSQSSLERIRKLMKGCWPKLGESEIVESWAGMVDAMPDAVPVMDRAPDHDGLYIATGFSGHGFGIGPGAGKVMARMITGKSPEHDLERFRLSRFTDGSKLVLGPSI